MILGSRCRRSAASSRSTSIWLSLARSTQIIHPLKFQLVGRHKPLPACFKGDTVVPAKLLCGFRTASAKIGFQTARGVVNPRVYDAAIMSGLMSAQACFFLEHDQACARLHFQTPTSCQEGTALRVALRVNG